MGHQGTHAATPSLSFGPGGYGPPPGGGGGYGPPGGGGGGYGPPGAPPGGGGGGYGPPGAPPGGGGGYGPPGAPPGGGGGYGPPGAPPGGGGGYGPPGAPPGGGGGGYGPPGAPSGGGGGYGPPGGPPSGGYGAPPGAPPGGGGYGAPPGMAAPPPVAPKKKSIVPLVIGVSVGLVLVVGGIIGGVSMMGKKKRVVLPVDAKLMPGGTNEIATQLIESTREPEEKIKNAYLASELGYEMCKPGGRNYASWLERLGSLSAQTAREFFFDKKAIAEAQEVLSCGALLGGSLGSPYQTVLVFDDDGKKRRVGIVQEKLTGLPDGIGFSKEKFSGMSGYCRTVDAKGEKVDCRGESHAMFIKEPNWFVGTRDALESMATAVEKPKEELTTTVSALRDAAAELEGLPIVRLQAEPKSAREFFVMPCTFGAAHSSAPNKDFNDGCFPKSADKDVESLDAKLRAAGYELDGDYAKAGKIHGSIVFVFRNPDSAKDSEKIVKGIVDEWKSHLEDNAKKLIRASREYPYDARTKRFAAIVDNYFDALKAMTFLRNGRAIRISFQSLLSAEDKAALEEAERTTVEKRRASSEVIEAIREKKPLPVKSLAKLVGDPWAKYLAAPPPEGSAARTPLTLDQCKDAVKRTTPMKITEFTTTEGRNFYFQLRFASCTSNPPQVLGWQRDCIARAVKAADLQVCSAMKPANEPADSDYGDRWLKR